MSIRNKFRRLSTEEEEAEDEADWQNSYSDLMTDLLAIFVILFAFAMMSQAFEATKSKSAIGPNIAAASAETSVLPGNDGVLPDQESVLPDQESVLSEQENFNKLYEYIKEYIEETGLSNQLSVMKQGNTQILLRVAASVFFDSGKADINPKAEPLLDKISEILTLYNNSIKNVRIEGHTDNRPINTAQFDSNWELSTSRAVNVLRRLLEISELKPKKFSAVGYSEFYPIADNDTEAGMAKNRRVDFFIEAAYE